MLNIKRRKSKHRHLTIYIFYDEKNISRQVAVNQSEHSENIYREAHTLFCLHA